MLGGVRDEVVPRSQMQELWAVIRNRGRDKKPPVGSEKAQGEAADEEDEEDEDEKVKAKVKEDERSGSSRSRPKPKSMPATGSGSGSDDRKARPKIVVDGGNTYIEFPDGMHSELCPLLMSWVTIPCSPRLCR